MSIMDMGNEGENSVFAKLGVDTGGTFTDFVWIDEDGRLQIYKSLSTPDDPAIAVINGVDFLSIPERAEIIHGSTVSTNALLERRGARTALITTAGFADVLGIGRQDRPDLYALVAYKPEPLVPRELRYEVRERITSTGEILIKPALEDLDLVVQELLSEGVESVAVSLLFSFVRPDHERLIRERIRNTEVEGELGRKANIPKVHITLSSELIPEFREYERTSTTVINAYAAPLMERYLRSLKAGIAKRKLSVMQNNGGTIPADLAGQQAARTILSGPAGGVVGALHVAREAGYQEIITLDMGGTSTDVALCLGRLPKTSMSEVSGMPIMLPAIDIHTVGAGGGSLAKIDAGGALLVGPESAGSDPGPVCYHMDIDRHNDLASQSEETTSRFWVTTTDANLVLGRLDSSHFLGGEKTLNELTALKALSEFAATLGINSPIDAAFGVINVTNANMVRAVRRISVEKGHDLRHFTLVAFGGAGPLHACELAQNLQISRVLVPLVPGVLSALGMLIAQPVKDYSRTVMFRMNFGEWESARALKDQFLELERKAAEEFEAEGHSLDHLNLVRQLDMRYAGQSHELTVDLPGNIESKDFADLFHEAHQNRYSFQRPESAVEIVNVRLVATLQIEPPAYRSRFANNEDSSELAIGQKPIYFEGGFRVSDMYLRDMLKPGISIDGPAVVFQYDTTTLVLPDWQAEVDSFGNLLLARQFSG